MTSRAAKYRRISDDREGDELGVTRQDEDLNAFAAQQGYAVVEDYADNDRSASTKARRERPEYQRMLRDAKAGRFDVVIAYTAARLTRRPREFEDLIELAQGCGIRFEYIRSPSFDLNTADGRQVARMLAATDAAESERIGERVSRAIRQRAERGLPRSGFTGVGYAGDAVIEAEAALVREGYARVLAGAGLRGVAALWNEAGMTTRHGNPWVAQTVGSVLRNPRNAGFVVLQGEVLPGVEASWPALVDQDLWGAVVARLDDPARRTTPGGRVRHLLSGTATCGICGATVAAGRSTHGSRDRTIKCSTARHLERSADDIEAYVIEVVLARLRRPDAKALFRPTPPDLRPLQRRAGELRAQRLTLAGDLDVDLAFAKARDRRLRDELARVDAEISTRSPGSAALAAFDTDADPGEVWAGLDLDARRAAVEELVQVVVMPVGRGRARSFDPDSVTVTEREVV